jgi:hypothetical protein
MSESDNNNNNNNNNNNINNINNINSEVNELKEKENNTYEEEEEEEEEEKYNKAFEQYLSMKNNYLRGQGRNCVKCGNKQGTVFEFKDGKYIAKCGNLSKPCKLNIELQRGMFVTKEEYRKERLKQYNTIANEIIQLKLDYLFHFKSETIMVDEFEKLKGQLQEYSETSNDVIERDNFEMDIISQEIASYKEDIHELKRRIQDNIKEYRLNTNNKSYIRNIIGIYKEELLPLIEQHRKEIYEYVNMEKVRKSLQKQYVKTLSGLKSKEFALTSPKIISFVR